MLDKFASLYPVTKTLRFRLLPQGRTEENMQAAKVLENDLERSEAAAVVKGLIKKYHLQFISDTLSGSTLSWQALTETLDKFKADHTATAELDSALAAYRCKLAELFTKSPKYKVMATPVSIIKEILKTETDPENIAALNKLNGYTYIIFDYVSTRMLTYSADAKATSLAYRLVDENYLRFYQDISAAAEISAVLEEAGFDNAEVEAFIRTDYNTCLTSEGIASFNAAAGSINQFVNQLLQQNPVLQSEPALRRHLQPLYKMLLDEAESKIIKFEDYGQLRDAVENFRRNFQDLPQSLIDIFAGRYDYSKIYVGYKYLNEASFQIAGGYNWKLLENALEDFYSKPYLVNGKLPVKYKTVVNKKMNQLAYSFTELQEALDAGESGSSITDLFGKYAELHAAYAAADGNVFYKEYDRKSIASLKNYLDAVNAIARFIKIFAVPEVYAKDEGFYGIVDGAADKLRDFDLLYNMVRNYITKKPYKKSKVALTFNSSSFGRGWDENKIYDELTTIFTYNGKYYLGVINKNDKPDLAAAVSKDEGGYKRMVYKTFDIVKQLPRLSFTKAVKAHFEESDEDYIFDGPKFAKPLRVPKEIYLQSFTDNGDKLADSAKKYTKAYLDMSGDYKGYYEAIVKRIDYTKEFLSAYKSTSIYDLAFLKPADQYEQWSNFTDDVQTALYKIRWDNIPAAAVDEMVESGKLYLFEIYSADLYKNPAEGRKIDTQAQIFKEIFSENGQKVIKLLGNCEVYFRPASLPAVVTHPKGSILVNKQLVNGKTLPDEVYREIYRYLNKKSENLSPLAKQLLDKELVKYRVAQEDIIKDKRFTENQYSFHLPVTLNYKVKQQFYINMEVMNMLRSRKDINILGINRGTRNLLYVTVINQQGEILYSRSLNEFNGVDYRDKLLVKERGIKDAAMNWQAADSIKNIKEGYLSRALGEIVRLMVKFNAICVVENLSSNFRNAGGGIFAYGNFYKGFETNLIKKLNCLIIKDAEKDKAGSVLRSLQMTRSFESFEKAGRQSGWLFMLDPAYISAVDPLTGFVNLFSFRNLKTIRQKAEFLQKFKSINYVPETKAFDFVFDYKDFGVTACGPVSCWVATSDVERIVKTTENGKVKFESVLPSMQLAKLFTDKDIDFTDGHNLISEITADSRLVTETLSIFMNIMRLYNYDIDRNNDYVSSPVMGRFDTRYDKKLHNPDELAAYNMARKGLMIIKRAQASEKDSKVDLFIKNADWFSFLQTGSI